MTVSTVAGAQGFVYGGGWIATKLLSGSGTYTPSSGCTSLEVTCLGDGGGGGGVQGVILLSGAGPGGQAGSLSRKFISPVVASYAYAVGTGGAGGVGGSGGAGTDGQGTTFGSMTAPGGSGAPATTADSGVAGSHLLGGSAAAAGSGGVFGIAGAVGGMAMNAVTLGLAGDYVSGAGGENPTFGNGGRAIRGGSSNGNDATGYAAGGGGATTSGTTSRNGGNGAPGLVLILEYS